MKAAFSRIVQIFPHCMNQITLAFPLIAVTALGGIFVSGCKPNASGPPPGAGGTPTVTISEVEKTSIPDEVSFVGRVTEKDRVDIRAQVSGILTKQLFDDGALVEKGDLLFEIESDDYEAAVDSAQAQLASAEAQRDNAQQYLKRMRSVKSGSISETELEQAEFDLRTAQASVDQAQASLKSAELDLKRTKIYAPMDGQIGKAMVDAGNLVDASTGSLAMIVSTDPIRVKHSLSERFITEALQRLQDRDPDLPPVRDTLIPRITLSTGNRYPHEGKIVFLDNEIGTTTGSIQAEAEFPNPDGILKPGQFVDLTVQRGAPQDKLLIPQSAVQQDQKGHFVLVVGEDSSVSRRSVETGEHIGRNWSILAGLNEGEKVIIQGIEKVRPGAKVNAVPPSQAPGPVPAVPAGGEPEATPKGKAKEESAKEG
ncbi:MAG: efflux transporter periplasmic adaptor subunit [Verrucomicrobiales bacterium]|nr:efflux transporter periplasmic adaptor subunit [Verrucomicrobiales bacterium]